MTCGGGLAQTKHVFLLRLLFYIESKDEVILLDRGEILLHLCEVHQDDMQQGRV
jgi:hypothetical protein